MKSLASAIGLHWSYQGFFLMCLAVVAAFLLLLDMVIGTLLGYARIADQVVDIQSRSVVIAKARDLAAFKGRRIVALGDSLMFGQSMGANGREDWRDWVLSRQIQDRLRARSGGAPAKVLNLGMNGAVPADLEALVKALLPTKPDLFIINIGLRSFSMDFATASNLHSRSWLSGGIALDKDGRQIGAPNDHFTDTIERFMISNSSLYRFRDLVQWRYLGGEPKQVVQSLREAISAPPATDSDPEAKEMLLLLKVRQRYANLRLDRRNPQFTAFVRMLRLLNQSNQSAIVFYATENPRLRPSLIDDGLYSSLLAKIKKTVAEVGGQSVKYYGPNNNLKTEHFLDHVHVTASGYRIYADQILAAIRP